jgi:hypothetical protein
MGVCKMTSVTLSISEQFKEELKHFPWVNWSEIAKEETRKKLIFEKYMKSEEISDEDWSFCEKIDWHPVDELPIKKEFIKEMRKIEKEKSIKVDSASDIFK